MRREQIYIRLREYKKILEEKGFNVIYIGLYQLLVQAVVLIYWLGGQFDAETFEGLNINLRQHDGGVNLAAAQFWKLGKSLLCSLIRSSAHGQGNQDFICVKTRIFAAKITGL